MTKNLVIAALLSFLTFQVSAQEFLQCEASAKLLYIDIQIFNRTIQTSEGPGQGEGAVGPALEQELRMLKSPELSLKEKVHSLETGFSRCQMDLNLDDLATIDRQVELATEQLLKMKNPLIID